MDKINLILVSKNGQEKLAKLLRSEIPQSEAMKELRSLPRLKVRESFTTLKNTELEEFKF
jgi:hypothetical protein